MAKISQLRNFYNYHDNLALNHSSKISSSPRSIASPSPLKHYRHGTSKHITAHVLGPITKEVYAQLIGPYHIGQGINQTGSISDDGQIMFVGDFKKSFQGQPAITDRPNQQIMEARRTFRNGRFEFQDRESLLPEAEQSAIVSHDHPEGIKGAQAIALAIYLARNGSGKEAIRAEIKQEYGSDLNRTVTEISIVGWVSSLNPTPLRLKSLDKPQSPESKSVEGRNPTPLRLKCTTFLILVP